MRPPDTGSVHVWGFPNGGGGSHPQNTQRSSPKHAPAQVLSLPPDTQRRLKPLLNHSVLRRLLQSLINGDDAARSPGPHADEQAIDPSSQPPANAQVADAGSTGPAAGGDSGPSGRTACPLAQWVDNPRVLDLLTRAARALRKGQLTEAELEGLLLAQLAPPHPGGAAAAAAAGGGGVGEADAAAAAGAAAAGAAAGPVNKLVLPSHLLVEALNEHVSVAAVVFRGSALTSQLITLTLKALDRQTLANHPSQPTTKQPKPLILTPPQLAERKAGGAAYRLGSFPAALHHYRRAAAILEVVRGASPAQDAEVARCRAGVAWCEAAVRMGMEEWGAAVGCCDAGLAVLRGGGGGGAGDGGGVMETEGAGAGGGGGGDSSIDLEMRLLVRRAKAELGRHDNQAALRGIEEAEALLMAHGPRQDGEDVAALRSQAEAAARREARGGGGEARLAAKMLRGLAV
jgi:hypothetical protein